MRRRIVWSAWGVVVAAALVAGGVVWWQGGRHPDDAGVAVRVNGDPIYASTLEGQFRRLLQAYQAIYAQQGRDLEAYFQSPQGAYYRLQIRYQAAQQLVDQVLIRQQVARRGVRVPAQAVEADFQRRWRAFLDARGISEEELDRLYQDPQQKRLTQQLLGLQDETVDALQARLRQESEAELLKAKLADSVLDQDNALQSEGGPRAFRRWLDGIKAAGALVFVDPWLKAYHLEQQVAQASTVDDKERRVDRAIAAYKGLLDAGPRDDPNLKFFLAQLYNLKVNLDLQQQRDLQAQGKADTARATDLQNRIQRNRAKAGQTFLSLGVNDEKQFELMLMADQDNPLYNYLYARFLLTQPDRAPRALRFLNKALELEPDYADAHALLGDYNVQREHYLQAVDDYQRALLLLSRPPDDAPDPPSRQARPTAVQLKLAEALLDLVSQRQGQDEAAQQQERLQQAQELLRDLVGSLADQDPTRPQALADLGAAAQLAGRYEEAQRYYSEALALRDDPGVRVQLGDAQLAAGQPQQAFQTYQAVLADHPHWSEAHLGLARYYRAQGQAQKAFEAYKAAFRFGESLDYRARRQLALDALELNPGDPQMHQLLAQFYLEHHAYAGAEEQFRELLRLDQQAVAGYEGLGQIAEARLHHDEALEYFQSALDAASEPAARLRLAERMLATERKLAGPGQPLAARGQDTLLQLAGLYLEAGRLADAQDALRKLRQAYPDFRPQAVSELVHRAEQAGGDDLPGQAVPDLGHALISPGQSHPAYNSVPPTSGWHFAVPVPWGEHATPVPAEVQLRNLAGGGVLIQYRPDLDEDELAPLRALVEELRGQARYCRLALAPYPGLERPITLTAWNRIDRLDAFDRARIVRFVEAFIGQGPELSQVPCG